MAGMPTKYKIVTKWKPWLEAQGHFWDEPFCWACRWFWEGRYRPTVYTTQAIRKAWDKAPLQRCHVIPKSLGGSDHPSNLFLMCGDCHDSAPNIDSRDVFLEWARSQNWLRRRCDAVMTALEIYGITDLSEMIELLNSPELKDWSRRCGLHWPQNGTGGPRLTASTLAAVMAEVRRERLANSPL